MACYSNVLSWTHFVLSFWFDEIWFEKLEKWGGSQVMFETGAVKPLEKKSNNSWNKVLFSCCTAERQLRERGYTYLETVKINGYFMYQVKVHSHATFAFNEVALFPGFQVVWLK